MCLIWSLQNKSAADLAKAVLEEVPGQLLSYFKMRGIHPNPPKASAHKAPQQVRWVPRFFLCVDAAL